MRIQNLRIRGAFISEILTFFFLLALVLTCFQKFSKYLNQTKALYDSVNDRREYRIHAEKLEP